MADTNLIYPYELEGGKKAVADEVMANFEAIQLVVAGLNSEINSLTTVLTELKKKPTREMMDIYYSFSAQAPVGAFPLWTGETINNAKTLYPQFWKKLNQLASDGAIPTVESDAKYEEKLETYGQCASFYINTLDGHVRLPKITKFISSIEQLTDIGEVNAGLPNITGTFPTDSNGGGVRTGAFYSAGKASGGGGASSNNDKTGFDASRSSSIYGKSSTVQPPAVRLYLYLQVANNTVEISELNTNIISEQLSNAINELENKKNECVLELENIKNQYIQVVKDVSNEAINTINATKTEIDTTLDNKANKSDVFTIEQTMTRLNLKADKTALDNKADKSSVYTKTEIDSLIGNIESLLAEV